VDLAAQGIEAETARPVDEQGEFVVGRVARDRAPDEGEVARVVERGQAHDGRQLGAGDDRAHGQTLRMRVMPPFEATPGINGWRVSTAASARPRSSGSGMASASLSALEALPHRSNPLWRKLDLTPRRVTNRGKHKGASNTTGCRASPSRGGASPSRGRANKLARP
jgi:hypothetical protein